MVVSCVKLAVLFGVPHPSGSTDPVIKDFNEHVQHYSDLRKKVEGAVPPIDKKGESDPAAILAPEQALPAGIQAARKCRRGRYFLRLPFRKI